MRTTYTLCPWQQMRLKWTLRFRRTWTASPLPWAIFSLCVCTQEFTKFYGQIRGPSYFSAHRSDFSFICISDSLDQRVIEPLRVTRSFFPMLKWPHVSLEAVELPCQLLSSPILGRVSLNWNRIGREWQVCARSMPILVPRDEARKKNQFNCCSFAASSSSNKLNEHMCEVSVTCVWTRMVVKFE